MATIHTLRVHHHRGPQIDKRTSANAVYNAAIVMRATPASLRWMDEDFAKSIARYEGWRDKAIEEGRTKDVETYNEYIHRARNRPRVEVGDEFVKSWHKTAENAAKEMRSSMSQHLSSVEGYDLEIRTDIERKQTKVRGSR